MAAKQRPAERALSPDFEPLFRKYRGKHVAKIIVAFAGEVDLTNNPELAEALEIEGDASFVIEGVVTGHGHKVKAGELMGVVTIKAERLKFADGEVVILAKGSEAAKAAKQAEQAYDDTLDRPIDDEGRPADMPPPPTPITKPRRQPRGQLQTITDQETIAAEAAKAEQDARAARVLAAGDDGLPEEAPRTDEPMTAGAIVAAAGDDDNPFD